MESYHQSFSIYSPKVLTRRMYRQINRDIMADERLVQFLKNGKDWERKATNIAGVFLLRLPTFKGRSASIAIEINPVDASGSVTKKRGIVIRSAPELDEISRLLTDPKIAEIAKMIDAVNPTEVKSASRKSLDVFEI
jgi:hypothetical protein